MQYSKFVIGVLCNYMLCKLFILSFSVIYNRYTCKRFSGGFIYVKRYLNYCHNYTIQNSVLYQIEKHTRRYSNFAFLSKRKYDTHNQQNLVENYRCLKRNY